MKIVSSSAGGNFKLLDHDSEIAEMKYTNFITGRAIAELNGSKFELKPKNFWTSKVEIFKDNSIIGDLTFNLKGNMLIRLEVNKREYRFLMHHSGGWKLKFDIEDQRENLLFSMVSQNNWTKLNYDYEIEIANFEEEIALEEFLLYCGYAASLYLEIVSAL